MNYQHAVPLSKSRSKDHGVERAQSTTNYKKENNDKFVDNRMLRPIQLHLTARKAYKFDRKDLDAVLNGYFYENRNKSLYFSSEMELQENSDRNTRVPKEINVPHPALPSSLQIKEIEIGYFWHRGVFAREPVPAGTRYGPYTGALMPVKNSSETKCNCAYSWEVYNAHKVVYTIDGSRDPENWMKFVNCARRNAEQNLELVQTKANLFYKTTQAINPGDELLVWYGEDYIKYMGVPITHSETITKTVHQIQSTDKKAPVLTPVGTFPCHRCGKVFSYDYYREKHLKYTRCVDMGDRKFPCHLCERSFEKKDRLRIHILHVHQKYRPHVCTTCGKRFSQSSSLNKHSRVHTGERPYLCPHCPKAFTASSILRTHLRQHNGERPFKCKFCGKAFASHAAHDSHVRRTHEKKKKYSCKICEKCFSLDNELLYHMRSEHLVVSIAASCEKENSLFVRESETKKSTESSSK